MSSPKFIIAVVVLVAGVAIGGSLYGYHKSASSKTQNQLEKGYEAHALPANFTLVNKTWITTTKTWDYSYSANEPQALALSQVQSAFSNNGYQTVAAHADLISPSDATLYRDNILYDGTLRVHIAPQGGVTGSTNVTLILGELGSGS